jgi:hypothetical protein
LGLSALPLAGDALTETPEPTETAEAAEVCADERQTGRLPTQGEAVDAMFEHTFESWSAWHPLRGVHACALRFVQTRAPGSVILTPAPPGAWEASCRAYSTSEARFSPRSHA